SRRAAARRPARASISRWRSSRAPTAARRSRNRPSIISPTSTGTLRWVAPASSLRDRAARSSRRAKRNVRFSSTSPISPSGFPAEEAEAEALDVRTRAAADFGAPAACSRSNPIRAAREPLLLEVQRSLQAPVYRVVDLAEFAQADQSGALGRHETPLG